MIIMYHLLTLLSPETNERPWLLLNLIMATSLKCARACSYHMNR